MTNKIALHIFLIALMIFLFYLGKCDEKLFGTKLISQIAEFGLIIFISSFIFFTPWGNNITEQKEYIDVIPEQNKYYNYEKRGNIISYFINIFPKNKGILRKNFNICRIRGIQIET